MKVLRCRDIGFECEGEIHAESDDEILRQAAEHAQTVHNVTVTPEMVADIRTKIRDARSTAS